MVVGRSCSERGALERSLGAVRRGAARLTREYLVLEGVVSAASSWRKDCSSFSSWESGFEDSGGGGGGTLSFWSGGKVEEGFVEDAAGVGVDHNQPILRYCERGW